MGSISLAFVLASQRSIDAMLGTTVRRQPACAEDEQLWERRQGRGPCFMIAAFALPLLKNYLGHGKMIGGFALVAYPAVYRQSGVRTFLVNHEGTAFERPRSANGRYCEANDFVQPR
jgi:hypothetical protein